MTKTRLIEPGRLGAEALALEASHETFVREFKQAGEEIVPWVAAEPYRRFADYVAMLGDSANGVGLEDGFVPHSTFWLVDGHDDIVAISNLRHRLNDWLLEYGGHIGYGVKPSARRRGYATECLRLTLLEAKKRGIDRVRVTCDKNNPASAKTILHNGGEFDGESWMPKHGRVVARYWIDLS
ncbi:MAG: GNAT family N-acetyltransferase [Gammaproteobacteria bacterium]|nr:GNAT family N-acetyltransferase [Gammaproteobacteria bacterium]